MQVIYICSVYTNISFQIITNLRTIATVATMTANSCNFMYYVAAL